MSCPVPHLRPLALALALAALAGCGVVSEAFELVQIGSERQLRDPLRPIRGTTRVLVIAIDGAGDGALREALAAGELPHLAGLLGAPTGTADEWAHAYAAPGVLSVLPSETAAGWAAVYTGRRPSENGIVGNEWFNRTTLGSYAPVPIVVGGIEQTLQMYTDDLLGGLIEVPTVFELADVRAHVAMGLVYRGADVFHPPNAADLGDMVGAAVNVLRGRRASAYATLAEDTWEGVARGFRRHGAPDLQVAYFPGGDLTAHDLGPEAQRAYLSERIDPHIGRIVELYRREGLLDSTYVLVVADHGHVPTLADDRHSLSSGGPDEADALFDTLGYRLREFEPGVVESLSYQAVMAFNEAFAAVYLADRSTCPEPGQTCDWLRPPRLAEDVMPIARAFFEAGAAGARGPGLQSTVDLVLVRALDSPETPFRVYEPAPAQGGSERLVPVGEYLARNPRPDLVDLERRLLWLTEGPVGHRAGDVLLLARTGAERPVEDRFYFGTPRASAHGGAGAQEGTVPLVLAHAGQSGAELRARLHAAVGPSPTQLDVTPLVLALLAEGE